MRLFLVSAAIAACVLSIGVAAAGAAAATPAPATVRIVDFAYKAKTLRVSAGARVTWRNADITNHSVTFHHGGPKAIGNLRPGAHALRVFPTAGRFTYVCAFHPFMHGTVVVLR
jgi:plastocyanin